MVVVAAAVATAVAAPPSAGKPRLARAGRYCRERHGRPALFIALQGVVFLMGKGDHRSRRGKIYQGSFGKSRPKDPAKRRKKATKAAKR